MLNVVSRAYTLKKYLGFPRRAGSVISYPAKIVLALQAAIVPGLVLFIDELRGLYLLPHFFVYFPGNLDLL